MVCCVSLRQLIENFIIILYVYVAKIQVAISKMDELYV